MRLVKRWDGQERIHKEERCICKTKSKQCKDDTKDRQFYENRKEYSVFILQFRKLPWTVVHVENSELNYLGNGVETHRHRKNRARNCSENCWKTVLSASDKRIFVKPSLKQNL
jgi:hypothetical protein